MNQQTTNQLITFTVLFNTRPSQSLPPAHICLKTENIQSFKTNWWNTPAMFQDTCTEKRARSAPRFSTREGAKNKSGNNMSLRLLTPSILGIHMNRLKKSYFERKSMFEHRRLWFFFYINGWLFYDFPLYEFFNHLYLLFLLLLRVVCIKVLFYC